MPGTKSPVGVCMPLTASFGDNAELPVGPFSVEEFWLAKFLTELDRCARLLELPAMFNVSYALYSCGVSGKNLGPLRVGWELDAANGAVHSNRL